MEWPVASSPGPESACGSRLPITPSAAAPPDAYTVWLDPTVRDVERAQANLTPLPADAMVAYTVSTRVNSPAHDLPDLVEPLASATR